VRVRNQEATGSVSEKGVWDTMFTFSCHLGVHCSVCKSACFYGRSSASIRGMDELPLRDRVIYRVLRICASWCTSFRASQRAVTGTTSARPAVARTGGDRQMQAGLELVLGRAYLTSAFQEFGGWSNCRPAVDSGHSGGSRGLVRHCTVL
jgi:hypothetical protein